MLVEYLPLLVLFVLAAGFVGVSMLVSSRLGPQRPNPAKVAAYESGIIPEPENELAGGSRFPIRFYIVAMLFIIFDVEAIFLYPWAVTLRDLGWFGFWAMAAFILLLFESYYYILKKGGLDWD